MKTLQFGSKQGLRKSPVSNHSFSSEWISQILYSLCKILAPRFEGRNSGFFFPQSKHFGKLPPSLAKQNLQYRAAQQVDSWGF